jgi:hypothetical protein
MIYANDRYIGPRTRQNGITPGGFSREVLVGPDTKLRNIETGRLATSTELDAEAKAAAELRAKQERVEAALGARLTLYKEMGHAAVVVEDEATGVRNVEVYQGFGPQAGELVLSHVVDETLLNEELAA